MAKFDIECEQSLGWAHSGEVTAKGKSCVDLTDEEVNVLVNLIREKGTTDEEACDFMYSHLNAYLEMDDVDYVVGIPQGIIDMTAINSKN